MSSNVPGSHYLRADSAQTNASMWQEIKTLLHQARVQDESIDPPMTRHEVDCFGDIFALVQSSNLRSQIKACLVDEEDYDEEDYDEEDYDEEEDDEEEDDEEDDEPLLSRMRTIRALLMTYVYGQDENGVANVPPDIRTQHRIRERFTQLGRFKPTMLLPRSAVAAPSERSGGSANTVADLFECGSEEGDQGVQNVRTKSTKEKQKAHHESKQLTDKGTTTLQLPLPPRLNPTYTSNTDTDFTSTCFAQLMMCFCNKRAGAP